MDKREAYELVNAYKEQYGFPGVKEFVRMPLDEMDKKFKNFEWSIEYMEAMIDAGAYVGYQEKEPKDLGYGMKEYDAWSLRVARLRHQLKYRKSDTGKKDILRHITPEVYKPEEHSTIDTASIRVDYGDNTRAGKKQTELNIQRLEYIKALEKSISKGGSVREAYERARREYKEKVDTLPTTAETEKMAREEKKRSRIPTLLLSWIIMPVYTIFKSLEGFCDSLFITHKMDEDITHTKFGSKHGLFGRMIFPFIAAWFIAWAGYETALLSGVDDFAQAFVDFVYAFVFLIVAKTILYLPFKYITKFIGMLAENMSWIFMSRTQNEFQMATVSYSLDKIKELEEVMREREEFINIVKNHIERNKQYTGYDAARNLKGRTLKDLEKETMEQCLYGTAIRIYL